MTKKEESFKFAFSNENAWMGSYSNKQINKQKQIGKVQNFLSSI